jgi:Fe-S-cluster containining protein
MDIIHKEGFDFGFDQRACESCPGFCCCGQSGNVWVKHNDILRMSQFLQTNPIDFISRYLKRINNRLSIEERVGEHGLECVFFDNLQRRCSIYTVRPLQCRTFPFWEYFKKHKDELIKECPGIKP